jgi:hypothetical protein
MTRGEDMHDVTVKKEELLERVRSNRNNHRAIFERAVEVYRERALAELEQWVEDLKNGRKIRRSLSLVEPVDYTKEYDRVITMLEMSIDDEIELTAQDFARFVMDDWEWKETFRTSTASYLKG